ncbi:MAG: hypothetical protein Q4G16_08885 [Cruoricaptor ignavus]|nr:hypothetical protein [Cruoricaptor ignavus]
MKKTNEIPFSSEWWDYFLSKNKKFTEPCVIKNCLNQNLVQNLTEGVFEMLKERYKIEHIHRGFRVYIEGVEQDNLFSRNLALNPPKKNENIIEYLEGIFDKKFGMIINSGEKYSDILSDTLLEKIRPLIEKIGLPTSGLELTIFIGNYGWTPLGIHQDHKGENVLHFHLGPGSKTMYTWDEDKYNELTNTKHNNKDILPLLKYAQKFPFTEGDLFYMPWNKFHVGYSDEISIGITLWFNNPTNLEFTNKVIKSFTNQYIEGNNEKILTPQIDYIKNNNSFNDLLETIKINDDLKNVDVISFFKHIYNEYKYSILSNGGWQSVPVNKTTSIKYNVEEYEFLNNKKIKSKMGYEIIYQIRNESIDIFVRGSKIEMNYFPEVTKMIEMINTNNILDTDDLLSFSNKNFPKEAGLYFLSLIYDKRGFEIME